MVKDGEDLHGLQTTNRKIQAKLYKMRVKWSSPFKSCENDRTQKFGWCKFATWLNALPVGSLQRRCKTQNSLKLQFV